MQFLTPIIDWLVEQKISIVTALTISLSFIVVVSVFSIVTIGGWGLSGGDPRLVEGRAKAEADLLAQRTLSFVEPLQRQLDFLEREYRAGRIDFSNLEAVTATLATTMNASTGVHLAGYSMYRGTSVFVVRNGTGGLVTRLDPGVFGANIWNLTADDTGKVLAPALYDAPSESAILPFVRRLTIDDDKRLQVIVAAKVGDFSSWMTASANPLSDTTFGLYGPDRVLAHSKSNGNPVDEEQAKRSPLAHVSAVEDPILLALWRDETAPARFGSNSRAADDSEGASGHNYLFRLAEVETGPALVSIVELGGISEEPWLLGTWFPYDPAGNGVGGALRSTWGVSAIILAMFGLVFLLSRFITQPVEGLSETARQVSRLQLDSIPKIPPSIFREFNEAADAFKTMSVGLDWFQSYVPATLVRKLLRQADDGELLPETKNLTIMFTDVVGFTRLSERMEAQDIVEMLNDHFSLVGQCIDQAAGTIDKYIGDGLMAFWGAPDHQPDHALRAVEAAEAISVALKDKNEARRDLGLEPIAIRIGIFTGRVSIGNIGAPGRINYTVIGDAVNAAQRLERLGAELMSDGDEAIVLVSGETIKSIERNASTLNRQMPADRFTFVGEYALDGREEPTGVYRIE